MKIDKETHAVHISGDQEVHIIPVHEETTNDNDNFDGSSGPVIK